MTFIVLHLVNSHILTILCYISHLLEVGWGWMCHRDLMKFPFSSVLLGVPCILYGYLVGVLVFFPCIWVAVPLSSGSFNSFLPG